MISDQRLTTPPLRALRRHPGGRCGARRRHHPALGYCCREPQTSASNPPTVTCRPRRGIVSSQAMAEPKKREKGSRRLRETDWQRCLVDPVLRPRAAAARARRHPRQRRQALPETPHPDPYRRQAARAATPPRHPGRADRGRARLRPREWPGAAQLPRLRRRSGRRARLPRGARMSNRPRSVSGSGARAVRHPTSIGIGHSPASVTARASAPARYATTPPARCRCAASRAAASASSPARSTTRSSPRSPSCTQDRSRSSSSPSTPGCGSVSSSASAGTTSTSSAGRSTCARPRMGDDRTIPMSSIVSEQFRILRGEANPPGKSPVFPRARGGTTRIRAPHWLGPVLAELGIEPYTWHNNRHTFCSWLAIAGCSLRTIQELAEPSHGGDERPLRPSLTRPQARGGGEAGRPALPGPRPRISRCHQKCHRLKAEGPCASWKGYRKGLSILAERGGFEPR